MIKVYQWDLNSTDRAALEAGGWGANETTLAYASKGDEDFDAAVWFHKYSHVANVSADDLEEVFMLMNHWNNPECVERLGRCASMSVGDIVEFEGRLSIVKRFGFEEFKLEEEEVA